MPVDLDYLPGPMLVWAEANTWLLDTVASAWLTTGEAPKQADLQQQAMALGLDVWIGGVLEHMPKPLGWVDGGDRRLVLSIIGLRLTPCMAEPMRGLGPLVALAVERFRTGDPGRYLLPADIERLTGLTGPGLAVFRERLVTELPFLGYTTPTTVDQIDVAPIDITDGIARYTKVQTTDDYLRIRADEIRGHPQFGWRSWESAPGDAPAGQPEPEPGRAGLSAWILRLMNQPWLNHPWVVGIGTLVIGTLIVVLILGHM